MTKDEALKLALVALEKLTTEMLALKDELAERGARPTTNVFHQRLWDSSFKAYTDHALPAATAIREALAQHDSVQAKPEPEQEPLAWLWELTGEVTTDPDRADGMWLPLYTTPPQEQRSCDRRTWIGLTDEDKQTAFDETQEGGGFWEFADAIEAKLKEKNT